MVIINGIRRYRAQSGHNAHNFGFLCHGLESITEYFTLTIHSRKYDLWNSLSHGQGHRQEGDRGDWNFDLAYTFGRLNNVSEW